VKNLQRKPGVFGYLMISSIIAKDVIVVSLSSHEDIIAGKSINHSPIHPSDPYDILYRVCGLIFCYRCSGLVVDKERACAFCFVERKRPGHSAVITKSKIRNNSRSTGRNDSDDAPLSERETLPSFKYEISEISASDLRSSQAASSHLEGEHLLKSTEQDHMPDILPVPSHHFIPIQRAHQHVEFKDS
jgi:hypothetical protein